LDVLARLIAPTPRHLGSYAPRKRTLAHVAAHKEAKRAKKELGFCLCGGADEGFMVCCDYCKGKPSWYHVHCLDALNIELPFGEGEDPPRGYKFQCPRCALNA